MNHKEMSLGFAIEWPHGSSIRNEDFLRSVAEFICFIRIRQASGLLQYVRTTHGQQAAQHTRMSAAVGIWQLLGTQLEDILMFCFSAWAWKATDYKSRLADHYRNVEIKANGKCSPTAFADRLKAMGDLEFLKSLGIADEWAQTVDAGLRGEGEARRLRCLTYAVDANIVRPLLNKLKHGPQVCVMAVPIPKAPRDPFVCVLFKGASVEQSKEELHNNPSHLFLNDEPEYLEAAFRQIRSMGLELWALASALFASHFPGRVLYLPSDLGTKGEPGLHGGEWLM